MPGDVARLVPDALHRSRRVAEVALRGSRSRGDAGPFSDWDFVISSTDFDGLARELPALVEELDPLARQWDRLSDHQCYMLIVAGPTKVDLIFEDQPHAHEPPWIVTKETLPRIDDHFWDWTLWLTSKVHAGRDELVERELLKMHHHLLGPMGEDSPKTLPDAVSCYLSARRRWSRRLRTKVDDRLGTAVRRVVAELQRA